MEESILVITAGIHERLSRLMACKDFGSPPKALREDRPKSVLIGTATKEQRAIALLYNQVRAEHMQLHKIGRMPFGVNPHESFSHYQNHVMLPILFEMLEWSVHRAYPEQNTNFAIRFDAGWNMYAVSRPRERKKKIKQAHDRSNQRNACSSRFGRFLFIINLA